MIELAKQIENAMMLPFVLFADEDGGFLAGYAGTSSAPYLVKTIEKLTASGT